ncbi:MAG: MoxR family ATPase [Spirochaetales bacterium]|nr:MoxR family ATPase [Spirochaetales bacterium]
MNPAQIQEKISEIKAEIGKIFIGQEELVQSTIAALFSGGHLLIEGVPGLGKTLLVRTLGRVLGCNFARIQFTPDLMPSDVTGSHIYNQKEQKFYFYKGPVFTNLLLADEINRAPAKTHSALLEIMQEKQVTIDNKLYRIEPPFFVLATQNPVESEGTYNLPEAQLDRFLLKVLIHYPQQEEEARILELHASNQTIEPEEMLRPLLDASSIITLQKEINQVRTDPSVLAYINSLVRATRGRRDIYLGASPRGGIALLRTSRVMAVSEGRDFVIPDDVKALALPALRHRIVLTPEAEVEGRSPDEVISEVIKSVEVPRS